MSLNAFETPKPNLTAAQLTECLARGYGLVGECTPLVGERDQNLRVTTEAGVFVLKIAHADEDRSLLSLQNSALRHIEAVDPTLGVPRVVAPLDGDDLLDWGGHVVRLLTYLPGQLYSTTQPTPELLGSLGECMGRLSRALCGFNHPASHRPDFLWNLDHVIALKPWVADVVVDQRELVTRVFDRYETRVLPGLPRLRAAVIHEDPNDNNILVNGNQVTGLIDFGDMTYGRQINDLAVTLAYALMGVEDIYKAAAPVIGAYARVFPIGADEATVLFDLVAARLAASVCISSHRAKTYPDDEYVVVSQHAAFRLMGRLDQTNSDFLAAFARHAAGVAPVATHDAVVSWLSSAECRPHSLFDLDLNRSGRTLLTLTGSAPGMEYAHSAVAYMAWLEARLKDDGAEFGIGLYAEDRDVYKGPQFITPASTEPRSQHLGLDVFLAAGIPVYAPLAGRVLSVVDNDNPYDYGPTVMLEHQAGDQGPSFWTLYGHLSREGMSLLHEGMEVVAGQQIGTIGSHEVNGGWPPHLHVQLITDRLGQAGEFPGVGHPTLWPVWSRISPDPNLIVRLAPESYRADPSPPDVLMERRAAVLGPSLSTSYTRKLKIVRGRGAYLFDHTGRAFVDGVNNICHVGHAHPHVVEAIARQAEVLNTNTRYLHDNVVDYAERLAGLLPAPLSVVYLVCSGSEANELALRMARTVTGRKETVVLDWAYHGNTGDLIEVSPYKFKRQGGAGKPDYVEIADLADPYRGAHKGYSAQSGLAYAASVAEKVEAIHARTGHGPGALIAESMSGCGGQVVFPETYLKTTAQYVRAAGGLVILDEVQTGFGRVGNHLWAFGPQQVVPDIVTLGKPIGNGHPMAAVVTTPEIAKAFANGMEFFSSFGGNPVSAAAGMAVLDVLEAEQLQSKARVTGDYLKAQLARLMRKHAIIGDVRGEGLFLGVELVRDRHTLEPATAEAGRVVNHMRDHGVLMSADGPFENVLKIKPPLSFGVAEAEILTSALDEALMAM